MRREIGLVAGLGTGMLATRALLRAGRHYDLEGKAVLITGGSRGLGFAMASAFAREGARVAICARDDAELEIARQKLEEQGAEVFAYPCDVTVRDEAQRLVHAVRERFGEINVLVNNAGVIEVGPFESMTLEDFEEAMQTHFYGPLYLTLLIAPDLRQRRDGRIVNIASFGGQVAVPHMLPYCASKFAQTGLSEGLRVELAKDNVIVTTVCPGLMRTGSPRHAFFKGHPLAEFRMFVPAAAMPLLSMDPDRAAAKIVSACKRGKAELILTPQAKLAIKFKALFPGFTMDLLDLADRLLPDAFGGTQQKVEGVDLEPPRGGTWFDRLNRFAALRFNEYAR